MNDQLLEDLSLEDDDCRNGLQESHQNRVDSPLQADLPAILPKRVLRSHGNVNVDVKSPATLTITNNNTDQSEIIFDYARAEGGTPIFEIHNASGAKTISFQVTYSETIEEIDHEAGDGPFFLFSNAMDSYRSVTHTTVASSSPQQIKARHAQRSQRYQKIKLLTPNSFITFSSIGFLPVRAPAIAKATFSCSDPLLNKIWDQGVRTVDMCTVQAGETEPAWDVTEEGTVVHGQHWAPCRHGTRWKDYTAAFEVRVQEGGASWGLWMVANGLIFCLDKVKKMLTAHEGLSDRAGVFPSTTKGEWVVTDEIDLQGWIEVEAVMYGNAVRVSLNGIQIAVVKDLNLHPLLGGSDNNTGSIAFGGPQGWISTYRNLYITSPSGSTLYTNSFLPHDASRTYADFAVGTNPLPCTIDGAKRDRATFGGDLHIMGRSIAYSTLDFNAIRGSIDLLTSHQTKNGYLGNLCPIQEPVHDIEKDEEPPTYAFYSLTYAMLLVVAIKDYWLHSGNQGVVREVWEKMEKLRGFVEGFVNERGLVEAPPELSLTFFPLVGPIFGVSTMVNLAYYDMLLAMARTCPSEEGGASLRERADRLREAIVKHLWDEGSGVLRLGEHESPTGIAQDVNAYGISLGISPKHECDVENLRQPDPHLPPAFAGLGPRFDHLKLCSPYAISFALEALLSEGQGVAALDTIRKVWGVMGDESNPSFSGCHWEAMTLDGEPYHDSTSLVHGWSTGPVYLLPQYVAGLRPVEPGWKRWEARPVYTGLSRVEASVPTSFGEIEIQWRFDEEAGEGSVCCTVPPRTRGAIYPPVGWSFGHDARHSIRKPQCIESEGSDIKAGLRRV